MHNNFYFLRQLSALLESKLKDAVISECFSQSKDELILRFETTTGSFVIKASLLPSFSCLSFPDNFQRARKNSVDLFTQLIGGRVSDVRQYNNERSFSIRFSDGLDLLFKMHGNRTNIILFQEGLMKEMFRNNLIADAELNPETLDREIDWSFENFKTHADNLKPVYFTFGKVIWQYLRDHDFFHKSTEHQWETTQSLLKELNAPLYYITYLKGTAALSLVKTGDIKKTWDNPIAAANDFYHTFTHGYALTKEKTALLNALKTKLDGAMHYIAKNKKRLTELRHDNNYRIWADLIMANMHAVKPRSETIVVDNFYNENKPVEIKLKKDLSPQKNAEVFYKKAKNQHIEIDRLQQAIQHKEKEVEILGEKIQRIESSADLKSLRSTKTELSLDADVKKQTEPLPYHAYEFHDYAIWVGKNAQSNDTLTLKYGYKEDLWLHAKDVSGSHVLIKHQAGKNFPKDVIEHAASLAAWHSKRKNESLCPVIVTPKKYVRKRKGDPAGVVIVEREEVILVEPGK